MAQSILNSIKKVIGLVEEDHSFDVDILLHTNSVFSTLTQLGVGPVTGFEIEDDSTMWDTFLGDDPRANFVKSYVYLKVRLLFDAPSNPSVLTSMNEQIKELEWRINVLMEGDSWTDPLPVTSW